MINLSTSGLKDDPSCRRSRVEGPAEKLNTTFGTAKAAGMHYVSHLTPCIGINRRSRPLIDLEFESYSKLTFASGQHLFQRTKNEIGIRRCCLNRSRILPIEYVEELEQYLEFCAFA